MVAATNSNEFQSVVFHLNTELYGIDIFRVHEIIRLREITPIPKTPKHIRGLVNLRGKTIPVIDLRMKLTMPVTDDSDSTRIIVVEAEQGSIGLVVDSVKEVITIHKEEMEEAPALVAAGKSDFVLGLAKQGETLITLIDLDKALAA